MTDGIVIILLIALGAVGGRLYDRRYKRYQDTKRKDLADVISKAHDKYDNVSDADLIKSIADHRSSESK